MIVWLLFSFLAFPVLSERWTSDRANNWYDKQPWLVGANYVPRSSSSQLEMWLRFNLTEIAEELSLASSLGMNTLRVFLHDIAFKESPEVFLSRIEGFLSTAYSRFRIRTIFVFFDSCWDPYPTLDFPEPIPGVHNSRWVQSPGAKALSLFGSHVELKRYVQTVIAQFGSDERVLAWDVWNEPDNINLFSYYPKEPWFKVQKVNKMLTQVFEWIREMNPVQPLTSALWHGSWGSEKVMSATSKIQVELSDIISFHNYGPVSDFRIRLEKLRQFRRPVLCTEWLGRTVGSTVESILPLSKHLNVAMINWGLVAGRTQTYFPWDSWQQAYREEPTLWLHDLFRTDLTPYRLREIELFRNLTSSNHHHHSIIYQI